MGGAVLTNDQSNGIFRLKLAVPHLHCLVIFCFSTFVLCHGALPSKHVASSHECVRLLCGLKSVGTACQ